MPLCVYLSVYVAATSDVLRQHGAQLTPAAYFVSLVTALSRVTSSDGKTAAAVLALLATCIPQVPRIILVEKFSQTVKALSSLLEQNKEQPVLRLVGDQMAMLLPLGSLGVLTEP